MQGICFRQNEAEPCMLHRKDKNGMVIIIIHVDDCYMIGSVKALDQLMWSSI